MGILGDLKEEEVQEEIKINNLIRLDHNHSNKICIKQKNVINFQIATSKIANSLME